jgi:hypothetical protein
MQCLGGPRNDQEASANSCAFGAGVRHLTTIGWRAASIALVSCASALAGCGDKPSQQGSRKPPGPRPAVDRVVQTPLASTDPSVLKRRNLPPQGVERQVTFGAAGDSLCYPKTRVQIIFDRRPFPPPAEGVEGGFVPPNRYAEPEVGEGFWICPAGFDLTKSLRVAVTDPTGKTQVKVLPPKNPNRSNQSLWQWDPRPGDPLGEYRVTATQGELHAERTFRLHPASKPNISLVATDIPPQPGDDLRVMLVGFNPRERVRLNVYGLDAEQGGGKYNYMTSVYIRVGPTGDAIFPLATGRDDPRSCGVLRVDIPAGPLDTGYCIGYE